MIKLLRQRNFSLLWFGGLISFTGDWMLRLALPAYIFQLTNSTLVTGIMFIVSTLPSLLFGSLAGVFVDRWDRRWTLIIANLLQGIVLLPLLLVSSEATLWIVYVVAAVQAVIAQFTGPAENALLPQLVGEKDLLAANSLNALNNNLARLIGPSLGGIIATAFGLSGVALLDGTTFLIAVALIALMRLPSKREQGEQKNTDAAPPISFSAVWREWLAGLRLVRQSRMLRALFVVIAITGVGEGVISVLFVPWVTEVLKGDALQLGWLLSAQAIGGLLGGVVIAQVGTRIPPSRMLGPCTVVFGLIDLAIFNYPAIWPDFRIAFVLFIVVGLPAAAFGASFSTLLQGATTDVYRGRIFGAQATTFALMMLVGMGIASGFGDLLGIAAVINIQGFTLIAAGILALVLISWRHTEQTEPASITSVTQQTR